MLEPIGFLHVEQTAIRRELFHELNKDYSLSVVLLVDSLVKWAAALFVYHVHKMRASINEVLNVFRSLLWVPYGYMQRSIPLNVDGFILLVGKKTTNVN